MTISSRIDRAIDAYKRRTDAPGQKDLLTGETRRTPKTQGEFHWITLHDKSGEPTTHVMISDDGRVKAGPKGLSGKNLFHSEPSKPSKPAKPKVGSAIMSIDDLHVDPKRFQYKSAGIDQTTGTNAELKKVKEYNPMLGGQILVWHDPEDGKTYVVNGHHRAELAKRSPRSDEMGKFSGQMPVYYLNAQDHTEARALGALANIAEGRGTATDAARFMRDRGVGLEDFAKVGVSPSGAVASAALQLKKLSNNLFQKLSNGAITEGRAMAIAKHLDNQDAQDQLFDWINRHEKPKRPFTDSKVAELARATAAATPARTNGGGGMFDDWFDEFPIEQRADITDYVRRHLSSERKTFKEAGSKKRKGMLESTGGNKLDIEGNRSRARAAELREDEFDHRANAAGHPLALALDQFAEELYREPKRKDEIFRAALEKIRKITDGDSDDSGAKGQTDVRVASDDQSGAGEEHRVPGSVSRFSRVEWAMLRFR